MRSRTRSTALGAVLAVSVPGMAWAPAHARPLSVAGTAGYLSEWQISARLSPDGPERAGALSGPVTLRHTGLCAVSGPAEKSGDMRVRLSGWGPFAQVDVDLSFAGARCVYRGRFSETLKGVMDCSDAKGVPVELVIR